MKKKFWTPAENEILALRFPNEYTSDIAKDLERTYSSVAQQALILGLKKSAAFRSMELSKQGDRLRVVGAPHRKQKGDAAWNKGVPMKAETYEKAKATMFKKGQLPHNTRSDGEESVRPDNKGVPYRFVRTELSKWVPKSRVVWERHHGKIPPKHVVWHINKDTLDDRIENLELLTMKESRYRNSAVVLLKDRYVANTIAGKNNQGIKPALLENPELLELKRNQIKLKRLCQNMQLPETK